MIGECAILVDPKSREADVVDVLYHRAMSGLKQLLKVSPALQKVVGSEMISRPQAVKKV